MKRETVAERIKSIVREATTREEVYVQASEEVMVDYVDQEYLTHRLLALLAALGVDVDGEGALTR